ncbi:transient receptor potential cation channel subfamily M member-like 2 [Ylistrum balloti]|uniref:transient receptor potential cation channel subfamily M member-like 2 n=1 Tax=Ylistrum balloti TaxID=509963 RepID=UPI002905E38A|nr:transient receptor potential cation channel subfamily M member-like 2 [Ylistrum balloti]
MAYTQSTSEDLQSAIMKFVCQQPYMLDVHKEIRPEQFHQTLKSFVDEWHLEIPKLVISVTGADKSFQIEPNLRKAFKRGLIQLARATVPWIISGGRDDGITKVVGEAVRDFNLTANTKTAKQSSKVAIGIASYRKDEHLPIQKKKTLNANHTHFLLVEDGSQHQFGKESAYRAEMEHAISTFNMDSGKEAWFVPVVLLVVGGGPNTMKTVLNAVLKKTPVVIFKGSGNVYEHAMDKYVHQSTESTNDSLGLDLKTTVRSKIQNFKAEIGAWSDKEIDYVCVIVEKSFKEGNLITVFDITASPEKLQVIDTAVLKALIPVMKDKPLSQLQLALNLNKIESVKSEIMRHMDVETLKKGLYVSNIIKTAIMQDRAECIEVFLEHEIDVETLLMEWIEKNQEHPYHDFYTKGVVAWLCSLPRKEEIISEVDWQEKVEDFITYAVGSSPSSEIKKRHFFLWCVLTKKQQMAKLLWKFGKDHVAWALVAYGVLKAMSKLTKDEEEKNMFKQNSDEFCRLAQHILNECKRRNDKKCIDLLTQNIKGWEETTCMEIALKTNNKTIVSSAAFLSLMDSMWQGKLSSQSGSVCKSLCKSVSQMVFLILLGYSLLFSYDHVAGSFVEWLLVAWMIEMIGENSIQLLEILPSYGVRLGYIEIPKTLFYIIGMMLRHSDGHHASMEVGRLFLAVVFIIFCIQLLYWFSISESIGPKVAMIEEMTGDLISFMMILLVFIVSYAIAAQSILYPVSNFDGDFLVQLFRIPYWNLYGELFLDEIEMTEPECRSGPQTNETDTRPICPSEVGRYSVPIIMSLYMIIANILLINLLIAIFSNTYTKIQENTGLYAKFQKFIIIYNQTCRPVCPPPLSFFFYVHAIAMNYHYSEEKDYQNLLSRPVFIREKTAELTQWEKIIAEECLYSNSKSAADNESENRKENI